jgi:uncharacterized membrane protein YcaP (DUF421 family)
MQLPVKATIIISNGKIVKEEFKFKEFKISKLNIKAFLAINNVSHNIK